MEHLFSLLEDLAEFKCEAQGRELLKIARDAYELGDLAYIHLRNHHFLAQIPYLVHTFPRGWGRQLLSEGHAGLSALLRVGAKRVTPQDVSGFPEKARQAILSLPHMRRNALVMAVHGPGHDSGILLATDNRPREAWERHRDRIASSLQLFLNHLFEAFTLLEGMAGCEPEELLTRRELECLHWCAQGKSYWETAVILGITERTVNHHMKMVREKLQVQTNAQAVSKAHALGLIMPQEVMAWQPDTRPRTPNTA